jgi:outer membrane protein assembly factor BamB
MKRQAPTLLTLALVLTGCSPAAPSDSGEPIPSGPIDPISAGTFPQYRLDPTHVGVAPAGTVVGASAVVAWKSAALGIGDYSASKSSPAVDGEQVYVGADDGRLHALDRRSGVVRWSFETHRFATELSHRGSDHRGIHGTPAVDACCVYVGDYDGWLYAVDKRTGQPEWSVRLGDYIGSSPVLYHGFVFIAVEFDPRDGQVFVVRAADGQIAYAGPRLGEQAHASVTIDPQRGYLFVGANNGQLHCVDFVRRRTVWRFEALGPIKSTAAITADTVYFTAWDFQLHAVAIDSGVERFAVACKNMSMSSPSVHDGRVYFGCHDDRIYGVDAQSGALLWSFATEGSVLSSPTIVADSGVLAVGSRDRRLYLLDLSDGSLAGSFDLGQGVTSVPVAVGNSLFVNDNAGIVWRFDSP